MPWEACVYTYVSKLRDISDDGIHGTALLSAFVNIKIFIFLRRE